MAQDPSISTDEYGMPIVVAPTVSVVEKNPYKGLNPDLAEVLAKADDDYQATYGKPLPITSKTRTREEQQSLFDRWRKGDKGIYMPINPSDYPKKDLFHTDAVDISQEVPDNFLMKHGLHRPLGKNDPVHTTLMPQYHHEDDILGINTPSSKTQIQQPHEDVLGVGGGDIDPSLLAEAKTVGVPAVSSVGGNIVPKGSLESFISGVKTGGESSVIGLPQLGAKMIGAGKGNILDRAATAIEEENAPYRTEHPVANIGGQIVGATPLALAPVGKIEEGMSVGKTILQTAKGGAFAGLAQSVGDPENYWLNKAKQVGGGAVLGPIGYGVGNVASKVIGGAITKGEELARKGISAYKDLIHVFESRGGQPAAQAAASVADDPAVQAAVKAGLPAELHETIANSTPVVKQKLIETVNSNSPIDKKALEFHLKDQSLDHPLKLTEGQATRDPHLFSEEVENRANNNMNKHLNYQNTQAIKNLDSFIEKFAPDVQTSGHYDTGDALIKTLEGKQQSLKEVTREAYKKISDSNGGQLPIAITTLRNDIDAALKKELKSKYVPSEIASDLKDIFEKNNMTFEEFEALRTNLANEMRTNQSANARVAAGIIRDQLENIPMTGGQAEVKALADNARSLARFGKELERDVPAYGSVAKDKAFADNFVNSHIINAKTEDLKSFLNIIQDDPAAMQNVKASVLNFLKNKSVSQDKFSQANYNKALTNLESNKKLELIFTPEEISKLKIFGEVTEAAQKHPVGAHISTSGTPASLRAIGTAERLATTSAEQLTNLAFQGIPVGTAVRTGAEAVGESQAAKQSAARIKEMYEPGAGINKNVKWKEWMRETLPKRTGKAAAYGVGANAVPIATTALNAIANPQSK